MEDAPQAVTPDVACERGDEAAAAAAAGQLAVLLSRRVEGSGATREAVRGWGAAPVVEEEFGRWAEQENPAYRHGLFGATAVRVARRDGDRVAVSVDGFWLRSADAANGAGEFVGALWTYWVVWREGRWVPSSPPEAVTVPGAHTHKALPFIRAQAGFSGVPYVRC
ncbi:hypothetical protein ACQPW3_36020 [Actinosynnema sp. CA-248983]